MSYLFIKRLLVVRNAASNTAGHFQGVQGGCKGNRVQIPDTCFTLTPVIFGQRPHMKAEKT